jgi:SulP family sulfate permease
LRVAGAYEGSPPSIRRFDDLDHALEYCERSIVSAHLPQPEEDIYPIGEQLRNALPDRQAEAFRTHLQQVSLRKGEYLIRQGDGSDDLFFIERGRVAVMLEMPDATMLRINTMGPGTVVGETAFFLGPPRSATVVVETDITAYRLTRESLDTIRTRDPDLAIAFHEFMVRMLSERLVDANRLIQAD